MGAFDRCFPIDFRLRHLWKVGHLQLSFRSVTRPNRVHLRYGSHLRLRGLRRTSYLYYAASSATYVNGQFIWYLLSGYEIVQALPGAPKNAKKTTVWLSRSHDNQRLASDCGCAAGAAYSLPPGGQLRGPQGREREGARQPPYPTLHSSPM